MLFFCYNGTKWQLERDLTLIAAGLEGRIFKSFNPLKKAIFVIQNLRKTKWYESPKIQIIKPFRKFRNVSFLVNSINTLTKYFIMLNFPDQNIRNQIR